MEQIKENSTIGGNEIANRPAAAAVKPPTRVQIGGLILLRTDATAAEWGLTEAAFLALLTTLEVPVVQLDGGGTCGPLWVNCYALEYALFVLSLPMAMRKGGQGAGSDATVVDVHFQMASLLYGTLTREAVRERVRALARAVGKDLRMAPKRGRAAYKGRKQVDKELQASYNQSGAK